MGDIPSAILERQFAKFLEIASGFTLAALAPRRFSIQFHDTTTGERLRQPLADLKEHWQTYLRNNQVILANIPSNQARNTYDIFHHENIRDISPIYQMIDRQFYWIEGDYNLILDVRTSRPNREFCFRYRFHLSETESNLLRLNAIASMQTSCNLPDVIFNFANVQYN
jgi:hypothetical protein